LLRVLFRKEAYNYEDDNADDNDNDDDDNDGFGGVVVIDNVVI